MAMNAVVPDQLTVGDYSFLLRSDLLSGSAFNPLGEVIGSPTRLVA